MTASTGNQEHGLIAAADMSVTCTCWHLEPAALYIVQLPESIAACGTNKEEYICDTTVNNVFAYGPDGNFFSVGVEQILLYLYGFFRTKKEC